MVRVLLSHIVLKILIQNTIYSRTRKHSYCGGPKDMEHALMHTSTTRTHLHTHEREITTNCMKGIQTKQQQNVTAHQTKGRITVEWIR